MARMRMTNRGFKSKGIVIPKKVGIDTKKEKTIFRTGFIEGRVFQISEEKKFSKR